MLKIAASAALFLLVSYTYGQERIWVKQTKINEVIAFEKSIDPSAKFLSENETLSKEYYPLADKYPTANPVIVQRAPLDYLPVYAC